METLHRGFAVLVGVLLVLGLLPATGAAQGTPVPDLGHPAFNKLWARTDYPVVNGKAQRTFYFGPAGTLSCQELYREAPEGRRLVTYLDKARLELTNPSAGTVTAGLLAKELISGQLQLGDSEFRGLEPAPVPVAGDPVASDAPTYASFRGVSSIEAGSNRATNQVGQTVTATLNRAGVVGADAGLGRYNVTLGEYRDELGHNIANVFVDFFKLRGIVANLGGDGAITFGNDQLIDGLQVMGLPIAEPFWAVVPVGGANKWVLIQPFERRVVTYTPDNDPAFRVEMGNIGQHYKTWRHPDGTCALRPEPPPDTTPVPDPQSATINRKSGPWGTIFRLTIFGFRPNEKISFWLTAPDGRVAGTPAPFDVGAHSGRLNDTWVTNQGWDTGVWAATYQGDASGHKAIVWFNVTARPPAPAPGEPVPDGKNGSVTPKYGWPGTIFRINIGGFRANEKISFWLTAPDGSTAGTPAPLNIGNHSGQLTPVLRTNEAFNPGLWAVTYQGDSSGHQAIVYFRISG